MAFDGAFLHLLLKELETAVGSRVDKLYKPSRDELVFLLRKKDFNKRLILSIRSGAGRLQFTEAKPENPTTAPLFCMLARKHFSGAKLLGFEQSGMERVVQICFESVNEMGDRVYPKIVCEWFGAHNNCILVDGEGRILDALHRSEADAERLILPGAVYAPPARQNKLDITAVSVQTVLDAVAACGDMPLSKALLQTLDGCSPLVARELAFSACGEDPPVEEITQLAALERELENLKRILQNGGTPTLVSDENGLPCDFSYLPIRQYGSVRTGTACESYSALLDQFYLKRESHARLQHQSAELSKTVRNAHARAVKRLAARTEELKQCADREELRIFGELLKANLYAVKPGDAVARVQNYYDSEMKTVEIPLNPALSPAANAAKYFKDYKKSYTAEQTLRHLTEQDAAEIEYLESVAQAIEMAQSARDLAEIKEELAEGGYLHRGTPTRKQQQKPAEPLAFTAPDGTKVLVGRNNRQNDFLTTRLANKTDLWLHVKKIPGSHVIVCCEAAKVSEETLLFAARLAARFSKARHSTQVPVDYTPVRFVKKPSGAKPGMVIYSTNQTVYVMPAKEEEL